MKCLLLFLAALSATNGFAEQFEFGPEEIVAFKMMIPPNEIFPGHSLMKPTPNPVIDCAVQLDYDRAENSIHLNLEGNPSARFTAKLGQLVNGGVDYQEHKRIWLATTDTAGVYTAIRLQKNSDESLSAEIVTITDPNADATYSSCNFKTGMSP